MFKFMKSKKGFSLVELMIVVVIMAILVAVAVPIFNSVTGNARAKTCIDNQRTIISTINTDLLEHPVSTQETFTVSTDANGKGSYTTTSTVYTVARLQELFQTIPYCPLDSSSIVVTVTAPGQGNPKNDSAVTTITAVCAHANDPSDPHRQTKS